MFIVIIFFFQAEDGIRDTSVTGVQTFALPILLDAAARVLFAPPKKEQPLRTKVDEPAPPKKPASRVKKARSEERRVGKECKFSWQQCNHQKHAKNEGIGVKFLTYQTQDE